MQANVKNLLASLFKAAIALTPWILATWVFFWLDSSETWTPETPHRGKMSLLLIGSGMIGSFLVQSYFYKQKRP